MLAQIWLARGRAERAPAHGRDCGWERPAAVPVGCRNAAPTSAWGGSGPVDRVPRGPGALRAVSVRCSTVTARFVLLVAIAASAGCAAVDTATGPAAVGCAADDTATGPAAVGCAADDTSTIPGRAQQTTVIGRALDSHGEPLRDSKLPVYVGTTGCGEHRTTHRLGVVRQTDASGRFAFDVVPDNAHETVGWLAFNWTFDAPPEAVVPIAVRGGTVDVGDVQLGLPFASRLSNAQAADLLRRWCSQNRVMRDHIEHVLVEASRRSATFWIPVLSELWQYRERHDPAKVRGDLEMLTTMRRLQGKPDPLQLEVVDAVPLTAVALDDACVTIRLVNRDVDGATFTFTDGGDYRSGRLERWAIEAVDVGGRQVRRATFDSWMDGGGSSRDANLAPGEWRQVRLRLSQYLAPLAPGKYRIRVRYHNEDTIADEKSFEWRIAACSAEIPLSVTSHKIRLTAAERATFMEQIGALDEAAPVLLLDAASAGTALDIPDPTTPEERLLAAGWTAVPVLIGALEDPGTSTRRRAWVLALLYDVTGLPNPNLEHGAVGDAKLMIVPRTTSSGVGIGGGFGSLTGSGGPSREAQDRLIARWRELRRLVEVDDR
jgi:hypothetical protein